MDGGTLPAHSQRGASSAERWMKCPGSVQLIRRIQDTDYYRQKEDPEWTREGTLAHELAALCLGTDLDAWEVDEEVFPHLLNPGMMSAVQEYLDYVRSLENETTERVVEHRVHLPDFHPDFFGTLDCIVLAPDMLHVNDYKHGVGVVVEPDENPQLMYYAYGYLHGKTYSDGFPVRLTIVQPRGFHPGGTIRSWDTTVGAIKEWAVRELRPAMQDNSETFKSGEHCRFCPAKVVCPRMNELAQKALNHVELSYTERRELSMLIKALDQRDEERALAGQPVEGAKLVKRRADRTWKEEAEKALVTTFKRDAYQPLKLKSPAMVEKELVNGKQFVAEFAFTPDTGLSLVPLTDKRKEVKPVTPEVRYGNPDKFKKYL
jgi:hypothetical protein